MVSYTDIILLVILVVLAAFFAGIRVAFTRINRLKFEIRKKQGKLAGRVLSRFQEQQGRFSAISLIGFTIILVIYCIFLGQLINSFWSRSVLKIIDAPYLNLLISVFVATVIMLVLGLLIPRSFFRAKADRSLALLALPIAFFSRILYPVNRLISGIADWMLKYLFNVRIAEKDPNFLMSDPENFILQTETGQPEHQHLNTELFENALNLPYTKVRECMIPRKEIESLEVGRGLSEAKKKFISTGLSKLIIFEGKIDNIIGYIHQLDLFRHPTDIRAIIYPILAVPETMSVIDLLGKFIKEHKSIAWVVDEFGGTAGIITLEDLLEEIFGEIKDEHDIEELVEKRIAEKEYIFSGRLEIDYLHEKYGLTFPDTESETLSGFIIAQHETIPRIKDRIIISDFEFDILHVTETRIELVKLKVLR